MERVDTLLINGTIVTMNSAFDIHIGGAIAIAGDAIMAVGSSAAIQANYEAAEVIDCQGQVVIPGLVNAHTHVPMTLLRGLNDDLRLDVWLGYLMPLEREFVTPEFVRLGTQLACAEMIRSGITTFADMYYFESDIATATAEIGMRALLGQTLIIFPTPDSQTYEDGLDLCRQFIEKWNGHELIQPAVSPHAWYTATPELLRACADLALEYDVPVHTHVAETAAEVANCREQHQMPVVPWNEKNGLLDTKLLAAHCVHIDRGEMVKLKKAGAGIAHCPTSNLKLSSGIAQVHQMREVGVNVGIGTDGPASNNDLDMFEEMRLAALLAKVRHEDPTHVPARDAFEMATIGGARAVHMGDITGSLEIGKRADIVIANMTGVHNWPQFNNNPNNIYSRLIYAAKSTDVQHVMVNGQWLLRDQQLLTVDEAQVQADAAEVAAKVDAFVIERESSPYNKLIALAGTQREESFEVQIKIPVEDDGEIVERLSTQPFTITKQTRYKQYDNYFIFDGWDPDAARLRYRDDEFVDEQGRPYESRARLTLLGQKNNTMYPNAVMLSRSRLIASAPNSLRFYREYFTPENELEVHKDRRRWRVTYKETNFAINIDQVTKPTLAGKYVEIKARTWSREDAIHKAKLISEILEVLGLSGISAETREYAEISLAALGQ
ncbi:MAG: amidohydrolase family protein [Candidatus Promineifilaceae bacterium]